MAAFFSGLKFADFIPTITSGLGSFLSFGLGNSAADKQFERQKELTYLQHELNLDSMRKSNQLSIQNAQNAGVLERLSKQRAGFNLSEDGGYSPIAGASSAGVGLGSAPSVAPPSFTEFAQLLQNAPLVKAQTANLEEDARSKRIANDARERANNLLRTLSPYLEIYKDDTGKRVSIGVSSPEELEAWKQLQQTRSQVAEWSAKEFTAKLERAVAEGRLKRNDIIENIIALPDAEKRKLEATIANLAADTALKGEQKALVIEEKELTKIRKTLEQNKDTVTLLNRIFKGSPDLSFTDKIIALVAIGMSMR